MFSRLFQFLSSDRSAEVARRQGRKARLRGDLDNARRHYGTARAHSSSGAFSLLMHFVEAFFGRD
jgi:hypothetical protein